ncbi:glutaredoxin [Fenollaria sporofastidiosus]|uniref:glutaredoxin n=1 Tax=Fenollaria sporofastidiosus TaxID=2811778 RepID=UPI003BAC5C37
MMEESGVRFLYLDITENLANMKKFLAARDTMKEFDIVKDEGRIGIPSLILGNNERAILDIDELRDYLDSLK